MFELGETWIKNLSLWLEHSDQAAATYLKNNSSKIPPMFRIYNKQLYRGMSVDEKWLKAAELNQAVINRFTSWSKSETIAIGFLSDPSLKISDRKGHKILIKKTISSNDVIIDIHSLALFLGIKDFVSQGLDSLAADSALKEQEVLVNKGIRIKKNDFILI